MILAGDIGGTKAELGMFAPGGDARRPLFERRYPTREHASLDDVVDAFLGEMNREMNRETSHGANARPERAVFGIAGPVTDNRCEATNLPWRIDGDAMSARLGLRVTLLNDLATTAWGLDLLDAADLEVLNDRPARDGARALIAAGTGLGEAIVARAGDGWLPLATEGGHTDFGPRTPLEDELSLWLRARYGRVSYERILSGPGIADLHRFLRDTRRGEESGEIARRFDTAPDPAVVVTGTALDGSCPRARLALEMFVDIYGAEAGNLALKSLALGGVYVGGGIAPRLLPLLRDGGFVRAFAAKGRLSPVVGNLRIAVVLDPRTALWGAASYAQRNP